ncbi:MAG: hypothetical protein ACYCXU_09740 [Thermoleophilia bacterium]|jgi:hypothetical protein
MNPETKLSYEKPELTRHENLIDVTFECANWQCSVVVPSQP